MAAWHQRIKPMRVPEGPLAKPVTFIYPYYENPRFLRRQLEGWAQYPADLRASISVIVVDDGSPTPAQVPQSTPLPMRLFRIGVDVPWNWLAARNIGAHHAPDGWLLLTDMDHVVPVETARALVMGQHDPRRIYMLSRRDPSGARLAPHSASYFLTRARFWATGGYDEALSGHYGTDGEFRRRAWQTAPVTLVADVLERYEYVSDASTLRYARKLRSDTDAITRLIGLRSAGWRPKVLSFPYAEVSC